MQRVLLCPLPLPSLPSQPRRLPGERPLKRSHSFPDISDYLSGGAAFSRSKSENLAENSRLAPSQGDGEGLLTPEHLPPSSPALTRRGDHLSPHHHLPIACKPPGIWQVTKVILPT